VGVDENQPNGLVIFSCHLSHDRMRERQVIEARKASLDAHMDMFISIQRYDVSVYEAERREKIATDALQHADRCWQVGPVLLCLAS